MKSIRILFLFVCACCIPMTGTAQSITVNDTYTAQNLVDLLTNNSTCASTSNSTVYGDPFSGIKESYGYFNNQGGIFPFTEGLVLSTWSSTNSIGPFVRSQGGGTTSWLGDSDLNQALGIASINATVLEFDFIPLTNFISFNYLFASNEYQDDFPCRFSDGFAFLIKEKGSTANYKNLAVLPGTTTPVSSTNIHPAISFTNSSNVTKFCTAINESYFGQLNTSLTNASPTNYSGQTKVLTAETIVTAGTLYHIKLVIADDEFVYYDSAVFIQAGSFISKVDLGSDRLLATNNAVCFGEDYTIDTHLPATYTYRWYRNNTLLSGEINPSYTVTDAGTYKVEITLNPTTCIATNEIKIEYTPEIVLHNTTLVQCDDNGDGFSTFDLTKVDTQIKNNDSTLPSVVYYESLADAEAAINPILNSTTYVNQFQNQILYAKVNNSYGCVKYAELTLQISNKSIARQNPFTTCDADAIQDGLFLFDLNAQVTPTVLNGLPPGLNIEYYLNSNDAISQRNPLLTIFNTTLPNQQIIYARIINGSDCYFITPITLIVNTFSPTNFQDENTSFCNGNTTNIAVAAGFSNYLWNSGQTTNSITIASAGDYSVTVTNSNGCKATKKFYVTASGIATITDVIINDFAGNKNSVVITYTGVGDYEFSVDGSYFQDNPQFEGMAAGTYVAYARDKNGCGLSSPFVFYVLDYPRYFTPNGDGSNDFWTIENLDLLPKSVITIFNRYGKLLKELSATSAGWNGTFNGYELPGTDYWFNLTFEDGKIVKGHFSLKR